MSRGEVVSAAAPLAAGYLAADPVYSIIRQFIGTSAGSTVAIDNKIEQAMDLVKSHLMFAVREEVDVLKEKITELLDRIAQLEYENGILRAGASPETLSLLAQPTAQQQASQQPPAAQPPQQQQQQQQQVLAAAAAQPVAVPLPLQQPQAPTAVGAVQPVVAATAGVPTQPAPQLAAVAQQLQPPPPSPQQPVQLQQPPQQAQQAQQQKQPPPLQQLPPT